METNVLGFTTLFFTPEHGGPEMRLSREDVVAGVVWELGDFEELVRFLHDADLWTPSRCEGWTAGDVAAHVIGQITDSPWGASTVSARRR
ncbi:MAG: maleylpyruvate isomerase N-terminal domain-containing protein [Acidimicrobiia bacterium]